ncbi:hypothetical protein P691DRAFT_759444 [Macrolepiota fuliginosa MF-IS2]|uniref:Uncharacterized protein n=1 Tax=Macrolepiota fuliginosa MF-IS2 TaxID=1400762 RepID=A0A9P5XF00_9AGAR|nr:hypothetical protein P691DRAFT_759444 [Macrolepiota fuliginosa MF-IS2]
MGASRTIESPLTVVNVLVQALPQSPDYEKFSTSPIGLVLCYFWNTVTAIVPPNVLISLFSSAYSDVADNAEAQYLAFFAGKTVGMIRAPDLLFPYFHLSEKNYAKLNRYVMSFMSFIPLMLIALYESTFDPGGRVRTWVDN